MERPNKRLAQHFLINPNVSRRIVNSAEVCPNEVVFEIGPGNGALTFHLLERAKAVIAIEIDREICEELRKKFKGERFLVKREDVLKSDLKKLASLADSKKIVVVGNIPYYITSPFIFKLLENHSLLNRAILTIQKEVACRIAASPGEKDYGLLSVAVRLWAQPLLLFDVSPGCFKPKPKVWSKTVRLDFFESPAVKLENQKAFFDLLKAAFGQRRKMLKNSLKAMKGLNQDKLTEISEETDIDLTRRAETLTLEEFAELANRAAEKVEKNHLTSK